jgi:predicted amidohydrolase
VSRIVNIGAAQLGPIARTESRQQVVVRLVALLREGHSRGCELIVFPELALTTFFPRWAMTDQAEIDAFFEREMPSADTQPLFDEARRLGVGFVLGYAALTPAGEHLNTSILVDPTGRIVHTYHKVHLPGHDEFEPWRAFQHLEKRYFDVGREGFTVCRAFGGIVGMLICNDRRWPEAYRSLGLQGVELVCIGYNTPIHNPPAPEHDRLGDFHNHLVMQSGAYQNGTWVVGVAKAGDEEGVPMIGGTCIVAPTGEIVALAHTVGDELVTAACDLDACNSYKASVFNFARHREPEAYWRITAQKGVELPPS